MKKTLIILSIVCIFIFGIVLSDLLLHTINQLFGDDIFTTKIGLEKKLDESNRKYDLLVKQNTLKQENLSRFIKELNSKDYIALTKDTLLTSSPSNRSKKSKILLKPAINEMFLKTTADDDAMVNEIKKGFNNKMKIILGVSKGILREKVVKLNIELLKMNNTLRGKNLELNEKLYELEEYKIKLEKHKKYITELEVLKIDLEKTVGDLETKIEGDRLKVSFKGDILFSSGSHKLKKEGEKLLLSIFPVLKKGKEKYDIFIAGHTDNVPIKKEARDKYGSNWDLSTYRAIEVVKYLISKGMNPNNLTAAGYGEYKPIAENVNELGKSKNRRVELFLIPKIIKRATTLGDGR